MTPDIQNLYNSFQAFQTIQILLSVGMFMGEYSENIAKSKNFIDSLVTQSKEQLSKHPEFETYFYPNFQPKPVEQDTFKV